MPHRGFRPTPGRLPDGVAASGRRSGSEPPSQTALRPGKPGRVGADSWRREVPHPCPLEDPTWPPASTAKLSTSPSKRLHPRVHGGEEHYHAEARRLEELAVRRPTAADTGAGSAALALHALAEILEQTQIARLTRNQHLLLRLGELIAWGSVGANDIYRIYFHGPAYRVMESAWRSGDGVAGRLAEQLPPDHQPAAAATLMEPRLIELCFQTAGIGQLGKDGRMALPLHVDRAGNLYVTVSGYRTVELPGGVDAERLASLKVAMGAS